jgi:hypothetical protein
MPTVEVGGLLRPVDRQVGLADLRQRFGGVLQPGGDLPVADVVRGRPGRLGREAVA